MRSTLRATTIALLFSVVASVAQAQAAAPKIAYINSQALMEAAPGRGAAGSGGAEAGPGVRATRDKQQDSARTMLTNYQKEEPTLTAAVKDRNGRPGSFSSRDVARRRRSPPHRGRAASRAPAPDRGAPCTG